MTTTTLSLDDILLAIYDMEYVDDATADAFGAYIAEHGFDDRALVLFRDMLDEEINKRTEELTGLHGAIDEYRQEIIQSEPQIIADLEQAQEEIKADFQEIGDIYEAAYNQFAEEKFDEARNNQSKEDTKKANTIREMLAQ